MGRKRVLVARRGEDSLRSKGRADVEGKATGKLEEQGEVSTGY